jgi:hypothetical protein
VQRIKETPLRLIRHALDESPARQHAEPTDSPTLVCTESTAPPNVETVQRNPATGLQPNPGPLRLIYGRESGVTPDSALRGTSNAGAESGTNLSFAETFAAFFRPHIETSLQEQERHGCRMSHEITFELTDLFKRRATIKLITRPTAAPTIKIIERPPAVQLYRVQPTGHEILLGQVLKDDLCKWLEHPTYPVQSLNVSLTINDHRIAFLFHDAMWTLTAHEEQRLYEFLRVRRRKFTADDFAERLHEHNIFGRVVDALNPGQLMIYFDAARSKPQEDLARIREFPEVDGTIETLTNSPYIHLIILSEGDATWSLPGEPAPAAHL